MAKKRQKRTTAQPRDRKTLSRAAHEQRQMRTIWGATIGVAVIVIGLLIIGYVDQEIIKPAQPIARVGASEILLGDFQKLVRRNRSQIINQVFQVNQQLQQFADNEQFLEIFQNQLSSLALQLSDPNIIGQQVLDEMIRTEIVRQEAERLGISVPPEAIERELEESFAFYRDGTPTPEPTLTPLPTEEGAPTAVPTPTLAPTADLPAFPTEEPYGADDYAEDRAEFETNIGDEWRMSLDDFRRLIIEPSLLRELVRDALFIDSDEIETTAPEAHARHILFDLEDQELAQEVLERVLAGDEDFVELVAEYSIEPDSETGGGDLGFFGLGAMVAPFEEAVFGSDIGIVPELVETQFGWHIIEVLDKQARELSADELEANRNNAFSTWLAAAREETDVETFDDIWQAGVPTDPPSPF